MEPREECFLLVDLVFPVDGKQRQIRFPLSFSTHNFPNFALLIIKDLTPTERWQAVSAPEGYGD
jgi:hypothetical protein